MKLEYLYNNNKNLKHTVKAFSIVGLGAIVLYFMRILFAEKHINYSLFLMISLGIIVFTAICNIVSALIIILQNKYKRNKYLYIKNNGSYYKGEIIMANYHYKGYNKHNWIEKDSGDIVVSVNDKTYKISDIDYNKEFKNLEQKLSENEEKDKEQIKIINSVYKEMGTLNKIDFRKITIEIYVLENKAVADLDSIRIN